ncbi:MAG TPA: Ig-like domain repeat protein [Acidimicrobiales bacterium]|nr:Ig-like domain repeat protein [Acidimicrobiales bacterium]
MAEAFSLSLVEGELLIRDADEPYALENPTSIAGTVDGGAGGTGAITGADFTTPTVSFEQEALGLPVKIDATFTPVAATSSTGSIDAEGNVLFQTALTVDLHIDVSHGAIVTDCRSTPVNLTFNSTAPHDSDTGRVTLTDPDFTIPPVVTGSGCNPAVGDAVNEQLAGGGHSLTLTLQGPLARPTPPECRTLATLAVDPGGESRFGTPVTLTATVAIDPTHATDPACDGAPAHPAGFVDLFDGTTIVGTVPLAGGTAVLTTDDLPAGPRALTAGYRGEAPYAKATSQPVSHLVAADPALVPALPAHVEIGTPAVPFDVEVTNTGFGRSLANARLDLTIRRPQGSSTFTPSEVTLEHQDDAGDWQPVTLTASAVVTVGGTVGETTGFPLAVGQTRTITLRLAFAAGTSPGPLDATFELVEVDPLDGAEVQTLSTATLGTTMVEAARRPSTTGFGNPLSRGPVDPHTVSQGHTILVPNLNVGPQVGGVRPAGHVEYFIDGRRVPARPSLGLPLEAGWLDRVPLPTASLNAVLNVPVDIGLGAHELRVKYSGDALFLPSQNAATFHVVAAVGTTYACTYEAVAVKTFNVTLTAQANMPRVAAGGTPTPLDHVAVRMSTDRGRSGIETFNEVFSTSSSTVPVSNPGGVTAVEYDLGPGTGTATSTTHTLGTLLPASPNPAAAADVNQWVDFGGSTGSLTLDGDPGQAHEIALESLIVRGTNPSSNLPLVVTCRPATEAIPLGTITQAGTSLTVAPDAPVRQGTAVTLSATVAPVTSGGMVEFRDGDTTIGVVPVASDGTATMSTTTLDEGIRSLSARYFGGLAVAPTSETVPYAVLPRHECTTFAEEGHGRTVRLVYLELLGRCPDQAGYDHWVARLAGGTTQEAFARTIARTPEAVGRVVDDAYATMLGRPADTEGRAFWTTRLRGHGRYDQLLADLGASGEFRRLAGSTDSGFITRVYERLLGRAPDAAGFEHWNDRLDAGASPRALILTIANLGEPLRRLVTSSYDEILDRAPVGAEITSGIAHLRGTGDRSGLYAQLIGTPEFAQRAQDLSNPED